MANDWQGLFQKVVTQGLNWPKQVILPPAKVDELGRVNMGVGFTKDGINEAGAWVKFKPGNPDVGEALVKGVNALRAQVGPDDETPGVLTLQDVGQAVMGDFFSSSGASFPTS